MFINYGIIGSDNNLSPVRRQDIFWTDIEILLIVPLEAPFSAIWIKKYHIFQTRKLVWKYILQICGHFVST